VIADSIDYEFNNRFYPRLRRGMSISDTKKLAWAITKSSDESLLNAINEFLDHSKNNGLLKRLDEKHYTHVPSFTYADAHTFRKHIEQRLNELIPLFKQVAEEVDVDWRFLAAVSYQESHWDPKATSPTGVRGLMMLTQSTASQLNISDRLDPYQSMIGGAQYFLNMTKKIPSRIQEPDKTWFALAAYNIGYGHLEDARVITQRAGKNPDLWKDVRESLPLLAIEKHYKKTKHGYARGHEPVKYVRNIRNYYDLMLWEFPEQRDDYFFNLFN
jgi:membrane-bound lytic murein transglycosylase F